MADTSQGATTTQTGHPNTEGFPPFNTETFPTQIFWFVIAFGVLYLLMSKIALPRISGILNDRQAKITGDLDDATAAKAAADEAASAYEKTLAGAKARAQATAQEAQQRMAAQTEARRKALEDQLSAELAKAAAGIADSRTRAMANVDSIASEAAAAIVQQLTGRAADRTAIASAIAAAKTA
jgi:F-type H+-transporting ATPase subunit b